MSTAGHSALTPYPDRDRRPTAWKVAQADGDTLAATALWTAFYAVGICLAVGVYAYLFRPAAADRWVLAAMLIAPSLVLAITHSSRQLDWLFMLVVINRLLRRLLDWGEGRYDTLPLLSLLPLVAAFLMLFTTLHHWRRLPREMRQASVLLVTAITYGMAIGLPQFGLPAIYSGAEYVTPLLVLYFCVAVRPTTTVLRRWLTVLVTLGVLAGVYGIWQWYSIPQWDLAWLLWSGMSSSMGQGRAFEFSICSSLESRGPASMFFAVIAALIAGLPMFRRNGGVVLGAIPVIALLLTRARTGLVYLVIGLVATALFAGRRGGIKTVLAVLVLGGVSAAVLGRQEESSAIFDRVATLGDVSSDNSAVGRVEIATQGIQSALANPLGFGLGSGGNGAKVGAGEQQSVGDNGYLEVLTTLGFPGASLYFAGIGLIVLHAIRNRTGPTGDEPATHLGLGLLAGIVPAMIIGNCLISTHASYVWVLISRHLGAARRPAFRRDSRRPMDFRRPIVVPADRAGPAATP